jgi:hypothetical protein
MASAMIGRSAVLLTFLMCSAAATSSAQTYPRWFLYQGEISDARVSAGYVLPSMYRDSSISYAFKSGCVSYAMYKRMAIEGSEAFWSTEGGNAWMGSDIQISFDTSAVDDCVSHFTVLDTYYDKKMVIVLGGDPQVKVDDAMKAPVHIASIPQPDWVERLPSKPGMAYAVGE